MGPMNTLERPTFTRAREPRIRCAFVVLGAMGIAAPLLLLAGLTSGCGEVLGDFEIDTNGLAPEDLGPQDACEPGEVQCSGAALQLCSGDGSRWITSTLCGSAELCKTDPPECRPPECALDQLSCDGPLLRLCNEGRDGWMEVDSCASAAHCNPSSRQCLAAPCVAGELSCNEASLQRCAENELGWVLLDSCATQGLCEISREDGKTSCAPPVCEAGARRCNGAQIERCNDDRSAFEPTVEAICASTSLCVEGADGEVSCRAPVCSEGQFNCTPDGLLQSCSGGRDTWQDVRTCVTPALCDAALGIQGCQDPVCEADERRCEGTSVVACRAGRDGFDAVAECGALGCNAATAACQPPACARDALRCQGARLEVCNEERSGFSLLETCGSEALCVRIGNSDRFRCDVPACAAGSVECQDNDLAVCNADLTGFDVVNCGLLGCANGDPPACRTLGDLFGN